VTIGAGGTLTADGGVGENGTVVPVYIALLNQGSGGGRGNSGTIGEVGSAIIPPDAGDGGSGGNGGFGSYGGAAGTGGQGSGGGGGAGGTVKIFGSVIDAAGAAASAAGGVGAGGNAGSDGRVLLGTNAASGTPGVTGGTTAASTGARDVNPYIPGITLTPFIPDLEGGAELFGLLSGVDATDSVYDLLFANAPDRAFAAVVQSATGPSGYSDLYDGFDFLSVVNMTSQVLSNPRLGVDLNHLGFSEALMVGGWQRDPANGGSGDETLTELLGLQVWATLVPDAANRLNFLGGGASVFPLTSKDGTSFAYLLAPIPLPAPILMLLAALGGLRLLRRRHNPAA
jgi:hypothetical protein